MGLLVFGEVGGWDLQVGGLYAPDLPCILSDGPVTGELARAGNIPDHLLGPLLGILSEEEEMINLCRAKEPKGEPKLPGCENY